MTKSKRTKRESTRRSPRVELEEAAHHEAGHAVAAVAFGRPFRYVTIEPRENDLGHVLFHKYGASFDPESNTDARTRRICERDALCSLAGPKAGARFAGRKRKWKGAASDFSNAHIMIDFLTGSPEETQAYFSLIEVRAGKFVQDKHRWPQIVGVARELLAKPAGKRRLSSRQVRAVCKRVWDEMFPPPKFDKRSMVVRKATAKEIAQ